MNYKAPRGTHDIGGLQARKLYALEESCRRIFQRYNFAEIKTPTFEDVALFTRSIGETTDIVEKEMYVFEDRKGRRLALRPEGTASVVRAYLENQMPQTLPVGKLFYAGAMFRYERPQAGRYREFYQIGAEYFGNPSPAADAEIIVMTKDLLSAAGIREMKVHLHTLGCACCRPKFRAALTDYLSRKTDLCEDCKRRAGTNPLRVLDCKIDGAKLDNLPLMVDLLCEDCAAHFTQVQELLRAAGCAFEIDTRLVRGLDYYTRTIFEIRSTGLGSQDALAAGGRYDTLVKELGGAATPAVGFALGSERVLMAAENLKTAPPLPALPVLFIAVSGAQFGTEAFRLASYLRALPSLDILLPSTTSFTVEGPFPDRSLKSQFRLADKIAAAKVIIFGEEEFARDVVLVRDMATQNQEEISLASLYQK
jgi:histidyl-tRNA synthetase